MQNQRINNIKSIKELSELLLSVEKDNNLFDLKPNGFELWERLRFEIFTKYAILSGLYNEPHIGTKKSVYTALKHFFLSFYYFIFRNPFITKQKDYFFACNPRRQFIDGKWKDVYSDYFIDLLSDDSVYLIERTFNGDHFTPTSRRIKYIDLFEFFARYTFPIVSRFINITYNTEVKKLKAVLNSNIGKIDDLDSRIKKKYYYSLIYIRLYKLIFKIVKPRLVFLVGWYGNHDLIKAAKKKMIPAIEFQHGTMSDFHFGYNYDYLPESAPDYFLSFGAYWHDKIGHVAKTKVRVAGFPRINHLMEQVSHINENSEKRILFISQGSIGDRLIQYAINLSEKLDDYRIVYKPHPGENMDYLSKREVVNSNIEVAPRSSNIYDLIYQSEYIIGVYSTAIYEALAFDKSVITVDLPGTEYLDDLVQAGVVQRISSIDELLKSIKQDKLKNNSINKSKIIFDLKYKVNFMDIIRELVDDAQ